MEIETTRLGVVLLTGLLGLALAGPGVGVTTAQESPDTAEAYFETLRGMEDLTVFDSYGELETVHTQSLTAVQVGDFTEQKATELDYVIATVRSFQTAQDRFEADEYRASLRAADDVEANISRLREQDQSLAALSRLALTRYYAQLGDELATAADNAEATPAEIELRSMASDAYRGANNPNQAAEYTRQVERLEAELAADREQMNASAAAMGEFAQRCSDCESVTGALTTHNVGVFELYTRSMGVQPQLLDAVSSTQRHGLDQREAQLSEQAGTATAMRSSLAVSSTLLVVAYGSVVALLTVLIVSRVFAWKRTYEMTQVDSVVVMGDSNV